MSFLGMFDLVGCLLTGHDWTYYTDAKGRYRICDDCDAVERI